MYTLQDYKIEEEKMRAEKITAIPSILLKLRYR